MKIELKEKIIERIRREHHITIKKEDPLFAMVTANQIIIEENLKELHKIFTKQQIEAETATENYLNRAKTILEEQIKHILKEIRQEEKILQNRQIKDANAYYENPFLLIITGIIIGYSVALFIL